MGLILTKETPQELKTTKKVHTSQISRLTPISIGVGSTRPPGMGRIGPEGLPDWVKSVPDTFPKS